VKRRRWAARLRAAGRYLVQGLAMLDHSALLAARAAIPPDPSTRDATAGRAVGPGLTDPPLLGPPPGHPDRLVPDVPPSEVERALFVQLCAMPGTPPELTGGGFWPAH
jgi:hypothetical protein